MSPLRYAVIGTGMMGREHIRNLALLRDRAEPGLVLAAVVDPDEAMRSAAVEEAARAGFGDLHLVAEHRQLPLDSLDAVVLVSPNHTHRAVLSDLLDSGVAILAEKPLCTTVADCESLLDALDARTHPAPFWVAMEYRYMPQTARLIERARSGEIGRLRMLSIREHRYPFLDKVGHWNRFSANTGGTLVEKCCHHFDLMRLLTGSEPRRIYASGGMDVNHLDECYAGRRADILDNALVTVDFQDGVRASLDLCMFAEGADPQESISLVGESGRLDAFIPAPGRFRAEDRAAHGRVVFSPRNGAVEEEIVTGNSRLEQAGDHHGATFYQHERFARAVRGTGPVEVDAVAGTLAVAMGAAAHASIERGQPIDFIAPRGATTGTAA